jgi:hypothetical protein
VLEEDARADVKPVTGLDRLEARNVAGSQIVFYRRPR